MKLRIKGNTLRLRLTQTEVDTIATGEVIDKTQFPGGKELVYKIVKGNGFDAQFANDVVLIQLPSNEVDEWASSDQVTIGFTSPLGDNEILDIAVEKDFQCLTERPKEDESDMFPNPLEKHAKC